MHPLIITLIKSHFQSLILPKFHFTNVKMKAVFVSLFTLAAGALASPMGNVGSLIARDQTVTTITTLTETVYSYTSSISMFLPSYP